MRKKKRLIYLFAFLAFGITACAYAGEVKMSTYYPAPYGEYRKIITKTLGVGDTNKDGSFNANDAPNPATNSGDVWIAGKIGIGTTSPAAKLDVAGDAIIVPRASSAPTTPVNGMVYYDNSTGTTGNKFRAYQNGAWNDMIGSGRTVTGVYTGTGATGSQIINVGFLPKVVSIYPNGFYAIYKLDSMPGAKAYCISNAFYDMVTIGSSGSTVGFQVTGFANTSGYTYYWVAQG